MMHDDGSSLYIVKSKNVYIFECLKYNSKIKTYSFFRFVVSINPSSIGKNVKITRLDVRIEIQIPTSTHLCVWVLMIIYYFVYLPKKYFNRESKSLLLVEKGCMHPNPKKWKVQ